MAGINRKSVRVLGRNVANCGVAVNLPRQGFVPAVGQATAECLSLTRHLLYADADTDAASRPEFPEGGAALAAMRAGRSGCSLGASQRRSPARIAGQVIQFGWPGFGRGATIPAGNPGKVARLARIGAKPSTRSHSPKGNLLALGLIQSGTKGKGVKVKPMSAAIWPAAGMRRSAAAGK